MDCIHRNQRENRYLQIIKSYAKKQQQLFQLMFFHLIGVLEEKVKTIDPEDVQMRWLMVWKNFKPW